MYIALLRSGFSVSARYKHVAPPEQKQSQVCH